jgi:hypothetical protein
MFCFFTRDCFFHTGDAFLAHAMTDHHCLHHAGCARMRFECRKCKSRSIQILLPALIRNGFLELEEAGKE